MNENLLELHAQAFYDSDSDKIKIEAATKVTIDLVCNILKFIDSKKFANTDYTNCSELIEAYFKQLKPKKDETKRD